MTKKISETIQSGDWKNEKHVPVIHAEKIDGGYQIRASIGDEIGHPNEIEHHIAWIKLFFQPEDGKFPIEVGSYEFIAHGEENIKTEPEVTTIFKSEVAGTIYAISYCNIHGLWENSMEI